MKAEQKTTAVARLNTSYRRMALSKAKLLELVVKLEEAQKQFDKDNKHYLDLKALS